MEENFLHSTFREKLIEHLLVGELLRVSWESRKCSLEISRPEVDSGGYDLIAEMDGIIRHIQLKTSHLKATTRKQKVHEALGRKPSGCVIWTFFNSDSLKLGPFYFFGNEAGKSLPSLEEFKVARHTKGDADGNKKERPRIREVPKAQFSRHSEIASLYSALFVPWS